MSMNFFAFFPALANPATNPNAKGTGFFANPAGPDGDALRRARRPGHLDRVLLEEARRGDEVPRVVRQGRDPEEVGASSAATPAARRSSKSEEFRKATPYNEAFYQIDVHGEGLLGDARICRTARPAQPARLSVHRRRQGHGQGGAGRRSPTTGTTTFKKYKRYAAVDALSAAEEAQASSGRFCSTVSERRRHVITKLDRARGRARAA